MEEISRLKLLEEINYIENKLGNEIWLTVYQANTSNDSSDFFYCALIPIDKDILQDPSWDLALGEGMPGHSVTNNGREQKIHYNRYGSDEGIEPLVIFREFPGHKPPYVELSEEFRFFHNLYFDKLSSKYVKINDTGDDEEVIRVSENSVQIRLLEVRQFLAVKEMHLAVYFESTRFSNLAIDQISLEDKDKQVRQSNLCYDFFIADTQYSSYSSLSRLIGKKIIYPLPKEKSGVWPYISEKEFEKFIIGVTESFTPVEYTSNPDKLANYFGANPDAPHYLTPIFFKPEVLLKYYNNPQKYTVDDGILTCIGSWSMRLDTENRNYVTAYLGDLGRDLPFGEQKYWRSFNIIPDGKISEVNLKRSFLGEFANPQKPDLLFKYKLNIFQELWKKQFGWSLFLPLHKDDEHLLKALHIPVTDDQAEFDGQILAITKILIEYLNENELEKSIKELPENSKSLTKLEIFLKEKDFKDYEESIRLLKDLWELRSSGIGHRKGKNYQKISQKFGVTNKKLPLVFEEIMLRIINFISILEDQISITS